MTEEFDREEMLALHDSVARQHALFLRLLEPAFQAAACDYYLLYRLLDTIEDCGIEAAEQDRLLSACANDFRAGLLAAAPVVLSMRGIEPEYRRLFERAGPILSFHEGLGDEVRGEIEATGRFMADGMRRSIAQFRAAAARGEDRFLESEGALLDYCHVVAGCVGDLNARLHALLVSGAPEPPEPGPASPAAALGTYLQLVNVLRDFAVDASERERSHVPRSSRGKGFDEEVRGVVALAKAREPRIRSYVSGLPAGGYRRYCETLFRVARLHHDFYARKPARVRTGRRPPAWRILAALPGSLVFSFLAHKMR